MLKVHQTYQLSKAIPSLSFPLFPLSCDFGVIAEVPLFLSKSSVTPLRGMGL